MSHSIHSFSRSTVHCSQKLNRYLIVIIRVVVLLHSSKPGQGCQLPMFDVVHKITMERVEQIGTVERERILLEEEAEMVASRDGGPARFT